MARKELNRQDWQRSVYISPVRQETVRGTRSLRTHNAVWLRHCIPHGVLVRTSVYWAGITISGNEKHWSHGPGAGRWAGA